MRFFARLSLPFLLVLIVFTACEMAGSTSFTTATASLPSDIARDQLRPAPRSFSFTTVFFG